MSSGQEAPYAVTRFSLSNLLDLSDLQRETALSLPVLQVFPFTLPRLVIVAPSQQCPPVAGCQGRLLCYPDDGWMGCKLCGGYLLRCIAAVGEDAEALLSAELQLGRGIMGQVVQGGAAERIDDTTQDPRRVHVPGTDATAAGEKLMVAPLLLEEQAIGGLAVWRNPQDSAFSQADLDFLVGLARQAAIAIENARLFSYEAIIAQEGEEGVAKAQSEAPDLILMDMSLLVLDGWEATRPNRMISPWRWSCARVSGLVAACSLQRGGLRTIGPFTPRCTRVWQSARS